MASGKSSKASRKQKRAPAVQARSTPWGTITAVAVVVLFAGAVLGYVFLQSEDKQERVDALAPFTPSQANQDPSKAIPGITIATYDERSRRHLEPGQRVAYTHSPPFGGAHDFVWAACTGVVYFTPVRTENLVHSLEHGAVWIAYDPARVAGEALQALRNRVDGQPYTMMAPYPGLDQPISLQSWGHQLKVTDAADPRIDQFIQSLRRNQYAYPETGASCAALGPGQFDQDSPPPFEPAPPVSAIDQQRVFPETEVTAQQNQNEPTPSGQGR